MTNKEGNKIVLNLALITSIEENKNSFTVYCIDSIHYLIKDENSQKLFDWLGAKTEKDMSTKQDLDSAVKNSMQQVQNLLAQIKK